MLNFCNSFLLSLNLDILTSWSLWVTVTSMANGYLLISIAETGHCMMHCILMMRCIRNSHGMHVSEWHLELQEPYSK